MGPLIPHNKNDESSDSDEDNNTRHDRFRSERFKEESRKPVDKYRQREESYSNSDRHTSRRYRDRSPPSYYTRDSNSSSSYRRESRRSNHDRKDHDKGCSSKSNKIEKSEKKYSETGENERVKDNESNKKTLSSILKNFDKHIESKRNNPETESQIGPALPPEMIKTFKADIEKGTNNPETVDSVLGPALPLSLRTSPDVSNVELCRVIVKPAEDFRISMSSAQSPKPLCVDMDQSEGPELPSRLKCKSEDDLSNTSHSSCTEVTDVKKQSDIINCNSELPSQAVDVYGPALPPVVETDSYGPVLPPNFKKDNIQGPALPEGMTAEQLELAKEESEDEDTVGPLPEGKMNMTQFQLDLRASHIKRKLEEERSGTSTDIKKREEWMLVLPPGKASNLGLGPRTFRMREAPDMSDRSSWTDTPADKLRKTEQALSGEPEPVDSDEMRRTAFIKERDQQMDEMSQISRDQDRPQSLLEMHQKKIKKKKKKEEKEGKKKERRPFDRNIDLQVNRFDDAQKKAIFKKAQLLDTRFSSGESKYL